jgi:TonB family protein
VTAAAYRQRQADKRSSGGSDGKRGNLTRRRLAGLFVAATVGLLFTTAEPTAQRAEISSPCEGEGARFVGSKPRMLQVWQRAPRKLRDVRPEYPDLPPGTRGSGMWIGEILLDTDGKVSHIWTIRQARLIPPFPAFNRAVLDAVRRWQFEPFVVESEATPICVTVSVNSHWRQSPKAWPPPNTPHTLAVVTRGFNRRR